MRARITCVLWTTESFIPNAWQVLCKHSVNVRTDKRRKMKMKYTLKIGGNNEKTFLKVAKLIHYKYKMLLNWNFRHITNNGLVQVGPKCCKGHSYTTYIHIYIWFGIQI